MKKIAKVRSILVVFAVCVLSISGCTKSAAPTNVDIVKAVIQHEQGGTCNVLIPSINIVEKEKRKDDGSVPYHLKYKCMGTAMSERDVVLDMYQSKDDKGATVWLAR